MVSSFVPARTGAPCQILRGIPAAKPAGTSWVVKLRSQLQSALMRRPMPAANCPGRQILSSCVARQILIVHGSCKPAVKFLYQLQLRQAATLVKFYEGKPAESFIFYIYKNPILLYHKLKRKSNFNRIPHNTEPRKI